MKPEVTYVPKDMCPLDFIAELGERANSAWIFFDYSVFNALRKSNYSKSYSTGMTMLLVWDETDSNPKTEIVIRPETQTWNGGWHKFIRISAEDIAFKVRAVDPEEIFFLKMAE